MKGLEKDIAELKREIKANIFDSHHVTLTLKLTRRGICQMEDVSLMFEQIVPPAGSRRCRACQGEGSDGPEAGGDNPQENISAIKQMITRLVFHIKSIFNMKLIGNFLINFDIFTLDAHSWF